MKPRVYYKSWIFHKFWWKFEITMIFWSDCKENSYQLQNVLKNSNFFTKGVNYNEEKFSKWKSSVYLNLEFFATPW